MKNEDTVADKTLTSELHYGIIHAYSSARSLSQKRFLNFGVSREDVHGEGFFPASISKKLS